ncbi:MAG TPA: hypothetical protein VNN77_15985 [candidate division Zixibacteria bacterium]|nr:hypothetical protein [candidate division Zixibacteria bacterium]
MEIDFDAEEPGTTPRMLDVVLGTWVVRAAPDAPSAPNVLAQEAVFPEGIHFPRCLVKDVLLADLRIEVKFKPIAGECDQGGGLVFRYQDPENYYVLRANALDDFALFKCVKNQRWPLRRFYVRSDEWQRIMVECRGPFISGYWNDRLLIEARDETFGAGRVGLWTISDSVGHFDDLTITPLE